MPNGRFCSSSEHSHDLILLASGFFFCITTQLRLRLSFRHQAANKTKMTSSFLLFSFALKEAIVFWGTSYITPRGESHKSNLTEPSRISWLMTHMAIKLTTDDHWLFKVPICPDTDMNTYSSRQMNTRTNLYSCHKIWMTLGLWDVASPVAPRFDSAAA